jgi:hypothetical protein
LARDGAALRELPIQAIHLVGLLGGEVGIAERLQLIAARLQVPSIDDGVHRRLAAWLRVSRGAPGKARRTQERDSRGTAQFEDAPAATVQQHPCGWSLGHFCILWAGIANAFEE